MNNIPLREIKINKHQAKKIFYFFSILLVLDLLVITVTWGILANDYECDYTISVCVILTFVPLIILGLFWIVAWYRIYEVFFMSEYEKEKKRQSKFFLARWEIRYMDYLDSLYRFPIRSSLVGVMTIFCFGIGYLFCYEIYQILNSFFKIL